MFTRCIASIEYVRVDKYDDEQPWELVYGNVVVTDRDGDDIVYIRPSVDPESKGPGQCLSLTGPSRAIVCDNWFDIRVLLRVKSRDGVTREIVNGGITWNPSTSYRSIGKPLRKKVRGERGSVTVGFSATRKAVSATINFVMTNELPAQIYGTIKAVRFLGSSSSTRMLFEKSANECVRVNPKQSIPFTRPAVFPVPVDSELTVQLDLWNDANDHIAEGSVKFTPIMGPQNKTFTGDIGQVRIRITCNQLAKEFSMEGKILFYIVRNILNAKG